MKKLFLASLFFCCHATAQQSVVYETEWISSDEQTKILREMDGNRLYPCKVEGRLDGIEIQYRGYYCPFPKGMVYFYSRWGLSDVWYDKYTDDYIKMGMTEHYHSTFVDLLGGTVHQATWLLIKEAP